MTNARRIGRHVGEHDVEPGQLAAQLGGRHREHVADDDARARNLHLERRAIDPDQRAARAHDRGGVLQPRPRPAAEVAHQRTDVVNGFVVQRRVVPLVVPSFAELHLQAQTGSFAANFSQSGVDAVKRGNSLFAHIARME